MLSRPRQFPIPQPGSAAINPHQIAVISHRRKLSIYILARALFAIDPRILSDLLETATSVFEVIEFELVGRSVDPSGCRAGISRDLLLPFLSSNHRHSPWGAPMTCARNDRCAADSVMVVEFDKQHVVLWEISIFVDVQRRCAR